MDEIEQRMQEIEDLLLLMQLENTKIKEKFSLDITEKPVQEAKLPSNLEERISKLEASLSKPAEPEIPKNISGMLEAMKARVQEIDGVKAKIENAERAFKSEIERLEASKIPSEKTFEQYLEKISRAKYDIDRDYDKLKTLRDELEESAKEKQPLIQRISESEINMEKTDTLFTKIKTLEEKIHADIDKIESLKDSIDAKLRFGLEKVEMTRKDIESRIANSEEKLKIRVEKMDSIRDSLDTKLRMAGEKITELERFSSDIENVKRSVHAVSSIPAEVTSLKKHLEELPLLKEAVDEEVASRISIEKRLQDVSKRIKSMEDLRSSVDEESIDIVSIDKRLQDITGKFSEIEDMKSYLSKESASIASIDKRLQDANTEISALKKGEAPEFSQIKEMFEKEMSKEKAELMAKISEIRVGLEKESKIISESEIKKLYSDVSEQKKVIDNMEKRLEAAAVKFFTENLEEFSKAIDRRLPELVRKEDYDKDLREVARKVQLIESPDITPLSTRVYMLERKIDDVHNLMRSLVTRLPVVVE